VCVGLRKKLKSLDSIEMIALSFVERPMMQWIFASIARQNMGKETISVARDY
jgi:hypothetical protein